MEFLKKHKTVIFLIAGIIVLAIIGWHFKLNHKMSHVLKKKHVSTHQKPVLQSHKKTGETSVYTYKVYGEKIGDPQGTSKLYAYDNLPYALCSKSNCTIDSHNPNMANCECTSYGLPGDAEWQKNSVGPKNLKQTRPTYKDGKLDTIVSNFSMANIPQDKHNSPHTTCNSTEKTGWANCYGVRCQADGKKVTCHCPIVKTKQFVSIGPKNQKECNPGSGKVWSAATLDQDEINKAIILEMYNSPSKTSAMQRTKLQSLTLKSH